MLSFVLFSLLSLFTTLSYKHFISPSHSYRILAALFAPSSIIPPFCAPHRLSCLISSSPGDRVQVTDDSNEEWWKVGNKSFQVCVCVSLCARGNPSL